MLNGSIRISIIRISSVSRPIIINFGFSSYHYFLLAIFLQSKAYEHFPGLGITITRVFP